MPGLYTWKLTYNDFNPSQEKLRETLCAVGNGYFATRGAAPEVSASPEHYPGTYLAGVYNKLPTRLAGKTITNEDLVNCPNWLSLTFKIGERDWYFPSPHDILSYRQELDFQKGILARKMLIKNRVGQKTLIKTKMLAHMANPHLGALRYTITPQNYSDWITVRTLLDGSVINSGVERYRKLNSRHLKAKGQGKFSPAGIYLCVETNQSKIEIAEAARVFVFEGKKEIKPKVKYFTRGKEIAGQEFKFLAEKGKSYRIEKVVAIYTSKDENVKNPGKEAVRAAKNTAKMQKLCQSHQAAWKQIWKKMDIQIRGSIFSQKIIRLHMFHLVQTVSPHNVKIDAGIPARGLHGEAYRGHIFWDEIFTFPFYNLHFPEVSKSLLLYRYRRLPRARKYAAKNGCRGAMFPWQSASSGEEETQILHLNPISGEWGPDHSRLQRHISFDIAYNVWRYWKTSGDLDFLIQYGAEIMVSVAQFGASLAKYSRRDGRYHTSRVMGPDEFHEKHPPQSSKAGLRDNAFTNLMIVWTLLSAQEILSAIPDNDKERLFKKLKISRKEFQKWHDITAKMNLIINKQGIIGQFDGYFGLRELDWEKYKSKFRNIERLDRILKAEGDSPDKYQVAKQADSLMFFYLFSLSEIRNMFRRLGYEISKAALRRNYEYYLKRTSHGSTLSKLVFCFIAYRLGKPEEAREMFITVLESDIYDIQNGTTPEGIHTGVMGGSVDIVVRAFAGVSALGKYLKINPKMPQKWQGIRMGFFYQNKWISLSVTRKNLIVKITTPEKKSFNTLIGVGGKIYRVPSEKKFKISLRKSDENRN